MDELDHRGELMVVAALIIKRTGGQYDQRRAQSLAAAADNVFGNRAHQCDIRIEPPPDHRVHPSQVGGKEIG
jgi:hypothetical protein